MMNVHKCLFVEVWVRAFVHVRERVCHLLEAYYLGYSPESSDIYLTVYPMLGL